MKYYYKHLLLLCSFTLYVILSIGQKQLLTGTVTDETGKPVAYASITFKNTNKGGTLTLKDGTFKTYIFKAYDTLICTHINYIKKCEKIDGNSIINLVLETKIQPATSISIIGTHNYSTEELQKLKNETGQLTEDDNRIFTKVEINASFYGGESGFQKYLTAEILYPDSATISDVKGIVKVGFVIGTDGLPKNISLIKGINKFTDKLVLDVISKMPKWIPALQNGRSVDQYKEVAVSFDITGQKK
jgi:hypothetical protein